MNISKLHLNSSVWKNSPVFIQHHYFLFRNSLNMSGLKLASSEECFSTVSKFSNKLRIEMLGIMKLSTIDILNGCSRADTVLFVRT